MGDQLYVRNWGKWQSYRSDRNRPPWIKVWRRVAHDPQFVRMSDAERGQLVSIWILAADRDGAIPSDPNMVRRLCGLSKSPNLKKFVEAGWLTDDVNVASEWRQYDANVTSTRRPRLDKTRLDKRRGESAAPSRRAAPLGGAAGGHDEKSTPATPKQRAFASRLLAQHGLTVELWLAKHDHDQLLDSHIDLIRAFYTGQPDQTDPQQQRPILESLDFELNDGGPDHAARWIDTQRPEHQDALRARLARITGVPA